MDPHDDYSDMCSLFTKLTECDAHAIAVVAGIHLNDVQNGSHLLQHLRNQQMLTPEDVSKAIEYVARTECAVNLLCALIKYQIKFCGGLSAKLLNLLKKHQHTRFKMAFIKIQEETKPVHKPVHKKRRVARARRSTPTQHHDDDPTLDDWLKTVMLNVDFSPVAEQLLAAAVRRGTNLRSVREAISADARFQRLVIDMTSTAYQCLELPADVALWSLVQENTTDQTWSDFAAQVIKLHKMMEESKMKQEAQATKRTVTFVENSNELRKQIEDAIKAEHDKWMAKCKLKPTLKTNGSPLSVGSPNEVYKKLEALGFTSVDDLKLLSGNPTHDESWKSLSAMEFRLLVDHFNK